MRNWNEDIINYSVYNSEFEDTLKNTSCYIDGIDAPDKLQDLFKDRSSTPRSSTPREKQFLPRCKIIFNLQQDDKWEEVSKELLETIYTLPTLCEYRLETSKTKARNMQKSQDQYIHIKEEGDKRIFETGGVRNGIITRRAWNLFEYKNHKQRLMGYQDKK